MKKFAPPFMLVALCIFSLAALAQDNDALPSNFTAGLHVQHANNSANLHKRGNIPTPHGFPLGVDTLVNFTDHFEAQGVYFDGSAHQIWEYSMVGNPPNKGGTTVFNAPVVPVSLDLRNADGTPRFVKVVNGAVVTCGQNGVPLDSTCKPLVSDVTPFIQPFLNGPVFSNANYSSSPVPTQITDAVQRAEFGNNAKPDWHTLLAPSVKPAETMVLPRGSYQFALNADGSCCLFVLINAATFDGKLFPQNPAGPDNTSIIGQAEVAGNVTTKDVSTFLFPNAFLFVGSVNNCCILGFHTFDFEPGNAINLPANGNLPRFFVLNYSSWISPGLFGGGFQDVTAHSHEIAETFNDPFVGFDGIHNITPFWLNPAGQCQDLMEDGDVIEDLPNATFPVTINGFTYHPQNEALLPWFEFEKNSSAIDNAYSYPDETVLTHLSAPQPLNCGR
ncbi:MAG TPA: hypothetical protein VHN74_00950 [Candidatus Angelobacter sp.]|jgi:hypothetical protein|nr:hypothetical protein [Candidatus Angelobacter sp.]